MDFEHVSRLSKSLSLYLQSQFEHLINISRSRGQYQLQLQHNGGDVMVQAVFSIEGHIELCFIQICALTAHSYLDEILRILWSSTCRCCGRRIFIYMDDNLCSLRGERRGETFFKNYLIILLSEYQHDVETSSNLV